MVAALRAQRAVAAHREHHDLPSTHLEDRGRGVDVLVPSNLSYSFVNDKDGKARQEQLRQMLAGPAEARQDLLTEQEFDLLRVVYEKPLRDMGKALLDQLMSSGLSKDSKTGIQLRPAQLQALNALMRAGEPVQVPFDLVSLRQVDGFKERQRIESLLRREIEAGGSRRVHGHTYHAEVFLTGPRDPATGMVLDLGLLRQGLAVVREQLDHHMLDEVPGLGTPTLENLCLFIAQALPAWHRGDAQRLEQLNDWVLATRETSEMRLQTEQMGRSLTDWQTEADRAQPLAALQNQKLHCQHPPKPWTGT